MSSAKAKGGRSAAQNADSVGVRKIHSRHTWVNLIYILSRFLLDFYRKWRALVMVKANQFHEKRFKM
jgi:hypothetical protein